MGFAPPGAAAEGRRTVRSFVRSGLAAGLAAAALLVGAPAQAQAVPERPALGQPAVGQPALGQPAVGQPALGQPAAGKPAPPPSTDLSIKLTNPTDAAAGKRITYQVVVHNNGPLTASRVQIDFTTTAPLGSVTYNIDNGHCYRSPKETACLFWAPLRPGGNASVAISGVMPRKIAAGTVVSNQVTLASATPLSHTGDDKATDVYRMGVARPKPVISNGVVLPAPSDSVAVNPTSKLAKITDTASKWMGWATSAVTWVFIVLAAAIAWFAIGLWTHRRRRLAHGDDDDFDYAGVEADAESDLPDGADPDPGADPAAGADPDHDRDRGRHGSDRDRHGPDGGRHDDDRDRQKPDPVGR